MRTGGSLNHGQIGVENVKVGKRVSDAHVVILCMLTISNIKVKT